MLMFALPGVPVLRLNIPRVFMVRVFPLVRVQDLGEYFSLVTRSDHVRILRFGTVARNMLLSFMAVFLSLDSVQNHDKKVFFGLSDSSVVMSTGHMMRGQKNVSSLVEPIVH